MTEPGGRRRARISKVFVPSADPQAAITNALASYELPERVLVVEQYEELYTGGEVVAARAGLPPTAPMEQMGCTGTVGRCCGCPRECISS